MKRTFVAVSLVLLGGTFYELSGGSDFVPATRAEAQTASAESTIDGASVPLMGGIFASREEILAQADARAATTAPVTTISTRSVSLAKIEAKPVEQEAAVQQAALTTTEAAPVEPEAPAYDAYVVDGSWVNMRQGPGTRFGVIDTLPRGTEVEVIAVESGWANLRVISSGETGWMAKNLLADQNT